MVHEGFRKTTVILGPESEGLPPVIQLSGLIRALIKAWREAGMPLDFQITPNIKEKAKA